MYVHYIIYYGEILLCDSNESINDFIETTHYNDLHSTESSPGIFFKFKRKLYWYINGKKSGEFSSYHEFKNSYTSNNSLWKIIKDDFIKTRYNAYKENVNSLQDNKKLMVDIHKQRMDKTIMDQQRRNIINIK